MSISKGITLDIMLTAEL